MIKNFRVAQELENLRCREQGSRTLYYKVNLSQIHNMYSECSITFTIMISRECDDILTMVNILLTITISSCMGRRRKKFRVAQVLENP